jgi:adenine deaminase
MVEKNKKKQTPLNIESFVKASKGEISYDLIIENIRLVNVLTNEIYQSDIGIIDTHIVNISDSLQNKKSKKRIDGKGKYAIPGFIDCHMHLESSMLKPSEFAKAIISLGTLSLVADPHEIANVLGKKGIIELKKICKSIPLNIDIMIPSTVPSAPGYENSGAEIISDDIEDLFDNYSFSGLGEVMDFNGVVDGDLKMLSIISSARERNKIIDGHSSILSGDKLQSFISTGITSDHTIITVDTILEKLRLGMWVQIQERFITPDLMNFLENFPVQDRIIIVTDDVPAGKLNEFGHLNGLLKKAVSYGLSPLKAIRYVTLNPATRMQKMDQGIIAPGAKADILLLDNLEEFLPTDVFFDGKLIAKDGKILVDIVDSKFDDFCLHSMNMHPVTSDNFNIYCKDKNVNNVKVNVIEQDNRTTHTVKKIITCPVKNGIVENDGLMKMTIFNRYSGNNEHSSCFISNVGKFKGALATTYAHDCHNLVIYSSNDEDATIAANKIITSGGGIVAVLDGDIIGFLPLPIAGLISNEKKEDVFSNYNEISKLATTVMGLSHEAPLNFITLMALAVSPEIKLTNKGLLDVVNKKFIPVVIESAQGEKK